MCACCKQLCLYEHSIAACSLHAGLLFQFVLVFCTLYMYVDEGYVDETMQADAKAIAGKQY